MQSALNGYIEDVHITSVRVCLCTQGCIPDANHTLGAHGCIPVTRRVRTPGPQVWLWFLHRLVAGAKLDLAIDEARGSGPCLRVPRRPEKEHGLAMLVHGTGVVQHSSSSSSEE